MPQSRPANTNLVTRTLPFKNCCSIYVHEKYKQSFADVMLCCDYENGSKFPSLKILDYGSISYHLKELYKNYLRRNYLSLLFDKKKWSSLKFWHSYRKTQCTNSRSSRLEVFCKKVFLEISQNSEESTCARASFLIKLLS